MQGQRAFGPMGLQVATRVEGHVTKMTLADQGFEKDPRTCIIRLILKRVYELASTHHLI